MNGWELATKIVFYTWAALGWYFFLSCYNKGNKR